MRFVEGIIQAFNGRASRAQDNSRTGAIFGVVVIEQDLILTRAAVDNVFGAGKNGIVALAADKRRTCGFIFKIVADKQVIITGSADVDSAARRVCEADRLNAVVFIQEVKYRGAGCGWVVEERYPAVAEIDCAVLNYFDDSIGIFRAGDNAAAQTRLVSLERDVNFFIVIASDNFIRAA